MKKKTAVIFSIVVFGAAGLFCVISALMGLFKPIRHCDFFEAQKGERINLETEYLTPCFYEVKHSVNLIPAGHEYYYAFMSSDGRAYPVRCEKSFNDGLEDADGFRHVSLLVLGMTGMVKRMKSSPELLEQAEQFASAGVTLETEYYLDTIYQVNYLWRLAVGIGFLLFAGAFVSFILNGFTVRSKIFSTISVLAGIAAMIGGIYLMNMG